MCPTEASSHTASAPGAEIDFVNDVPYPRPQSRAFQEAQGIPRESQHVLFPLRMAIACLIAVTAVRVEAGGAFTQTGLSMKT